MTNEEDLDVAVKAFTQAQIEFRRLESQLTKAKQKLAAAEAALELCLNRVAKQ